MTSAQPTIIEPCTIVFDLDGTLVNTAPDLLRTLNFILDSVGLAPVPLEIIETMIGMGAKAMMTRAIEHNGVQPADYDLNLLFDQFLRHYAANICEHSHPFENVVTVLDRLQEDGHILAVCTNKRVALAEQLLDELDLSRRFKAVLGADSVPERKPNGDHILSTIQSAGGNPDRAVMVGDSRTDERAARNAGLPFIFVTFGYEIETPDQLKPDAVISNYSEFLSVISEMFS